MKGTKCGSFYSQLLRPALVGIEAIGPMQWFLDPLGQLGIECRVGDAAKIRAAEPRKQKHNRRDAELILKLLVEKRFPAIWLPSKELLDLRVVAAPSSMGASTHADAGHRAPEWIAARSWLVEL
jgi:transposase